MIGKRLVEHKRKSATGFQNGVDTDQAVLDSIALRQLLRRRILVDVGCEVLKWPDPLVPGSEILQHAVEIKRMLTVLVQKRNAEKLR